MSSKSFLTPDSKPRAKLKLKAINQMFLFLLWLRLVFILNHFTLKQVIQLL